jgi:signal transduction histidine kinase
VHVADNGVGTDGARARGGLVNLRERAEGYGGRFEVSRAEPTGTEIRWSVAI